MEYIVIGAEVFAAIWFVIYILMINGFLNEGKKNGFKMKDPLVKFFIGNAKWAIFTGIGTVYVGTGVYAFDLLK